MPRKVPTSAAATFSTDLFDAAPPIELHGDHDAEDGRDDAEAGHRVAHGR
jgi:hypothetical protein